VLVDQVMTCCSASFFCEDSAYEEMALCLTRAREKGVTVEEYDVHFRITFTGLRGFMQAFIGNAAHISPITNTAFIEMFLFLNKWHLDAF
jgi:hypothetical protein